MLNFKYWSHNRYPYISKIPKLPIPKRHPEVKGGKIMKHIKKLETFPGTLFWFIFRLDDGFFKCLKKTKSTKVYHFLYSYLRMLSSHLKDNLIGINDLGKHFLFHRTLYVLHYFLDLSIITLILLTQSSQSSFTQLESVIMQF